MGAESGAEICERLHVVRPGLKVLLISGAGSISSRAAASCGASGFVTKDRRGADLVRAVRMVAMGLSVFEQDDPVVGPHPELSDRERQVLGLLASGATNREIADRLHLSPHTVKEYASALTASSRSGAGSKRRTRRAARTRSTDPVALAMGVDPPDRQACWRASPPPATVEVMSIVTTAPLRAVPPTEARTAATIASVGTSVP